MKNKFHNGSYEDRIGLGKTTKIIWKSNMAS